jgi:formylglycine-generating enzyme required for sulfatase activity
MMGELGADAAREQADRAARDPEAEYLPAFDLAGPLASMQPVHEVQVAPFFLAEDLIAGQWQSRFELTQIRGHENFNRLALERLAQHGWRLPSEAEVELTRLLPPPLCALGRGWCQDTWHPNYVGAPLDARPWGTDATLEVDGLRKRFDLTRRRACVRAACSLFAETARGGR